MHFATQKHDFTYSAKLYYCKQEWLFADLQYELDIYGDDVFGVLTVIHAMYVIWGRASQTSFRRVTIPLGRLKHIWAVKQVRPNSSMGKLHLAGC